MVCRGEIAVPSKNGAKAAASQTPDLCAVVFGSAAVQVLIACKVMLPKLRGQKWCVKPGAMEHEVFLAIFLVYLIIL